MGVVDESMYSRYEVGDYVKILRGTLEGSEGTIESIDTESGLVKVSTVFFGRSTTVEVEFTEIEKI